MMRKQPIFITGLPRSGTSMIAGSLASMGVWTGETIPGNKFNQKGYFENFVIRQKVIKPILMSHGFDPLGVRKLPPRNFCPEVTLNQKYSLANFLYAVLDAQNCEEQQPWLYKDAKLSLIWRLMNQEFPNAIWIVVKRSRTDFIRSCLATDFMKQHSQQPNFWHDFAEAIEARLTDLSKTVHFHCSIDVDKIINGQFEDLREVCWRTGINFDKQKIEAFIDKSLMKKWNDKSSLDADAYSGICA